MVNCSHCGEDAVDTDPSSGQLVCTECCVVQKQDDFEYDTGLNGNRLTEINDTGIPKTISRRMVSRMKRVPVGEKYAHSQLRDLAKEFKLRADLVAEAERLLDKALKHQSFHTIRNDKKIVLAGCCLYATMRSHELPVQLSAVAGKLRQADLPKMAFIHKRLKSAFPAALESVVAPSASEAIESFVATLQMKNGSDLVPCTKKILNVLNRELLATSIHLEPLFVAVSYIAWRSQMQNLLSKMSLEKFCATYSLNYSPTCQIRFQETTAMLISLCKDLPWLRNCKIDKKNVFGHVDSILSNAHTLLHNKTDLPKRHPSNPVRPGYQTSDVQQSELVVSTSTELSDADLPDNEMDDYIFSNEEVIARKHDFEKLLN